MKNKIEDLRNHLFAQLEKLSDCSKSELDTEIDRAASMCQIADTIIESAKVEVSFINATLADFPVSSTFFISSKDQKKID